MFDSYKVDGFMYVHNLALEVLEITVVEIGLHLMLIEGETCQS